MTKVKMNKLNYDQYQLLKTIYNHLKEITKTVKQEGWGTKTLITQDFSVGYFKYKYDNEEIVKSNYIKWISEKISNEQLLRELQDSWYITYEYIESSIGLANEVKITMQDIWYQVVKNLDCLSEIELLFEKYQILLWSIGWWLIGAILIELFKYLIGVN